MRIRTYLRWRLVSALLWMARHARLRVGYVHWLLYRWSLIVAPVTREERARAVHWWDRQGAVSGYCRWPEPRKETVTPCGGIPASEDDS